MAFITDPNSKMNYVLCVAWVPQGVAKRTPVKQEYSKEELQNAIKAAKAKITEMKSRDKANKKTEDEIDPELAEYNLDTYDDSDQDEDLEMFDLADSDEDPYITREDQDSDEESNEIQPDDNLLIAGRVNKEAFILEVHVYNHAEQDFYVHHDFLLPSIPYCIEPIQFLPSESKTANLAAVGSYNNVVTVWDLDIDNPLEPAFTIGKPKESDETGKNAVVCLAWNAHNKNLLLGGGEDSRLRLWDIETKKTLQRIKNFSNRIQAAEWHPYEPSVVLAGSCDKTVKILDCRSPKDCIKSWTLEGEVERVLWNHFDANFCLASTDDGKVYYIDPRKDSTLWTLSAHSEACVGLCLSTQCPGLLVTASEDKTLKVFDIQGSKPTFVMEKNLNIGTVFGLEMNPDLPFVVSSCGEHRDQNLRVDDLTRSDAVLNTFGSRELVLPVVSESVELSQETPAVEDEPSSSKKKHKNKTKKIEVTKRESSTEKVKDNKEKRKKFNDENQS